MRRPLHLFGVPWLAVALWLCVPGPAGMAQRPAHYAHRDADLVHALELYHKAQYGAARYELERVVERIPDRHAPERAEAEFHIALCAVHLFNNDAGHKLRTFIAEHPGSQHVPAVRMELFRHAFTGRKWKEAIVWSDHVDRFALGPADLEEYRFKRGYAYFQEEDHDRALAEFSAVKNEPGSGMYAVPATYYAAHIEYERGNHATALAAFRTLENDPDFGRIVRYYIAEILYLQGEYDQLDAFVGPLLDDPQGTRRIDRIHRLAGEAAYRRGRYADAVPHLEKSMQRAGVDRTDRYMLGYALYRTGEHRKAINAFTAVAGAEDSLAQLATYHMADCYLQLGEKNPARTAFKRAYEIGSDAPVTEDALFQYAKLAYELSFDPYHEAINALRNYLRTYPDTPRRDEAYGFLLNVYMRTKNYEAALEALDEVSVLDLRLKEAYQRLAYDRGVELYEARKYADAALFFERALKHPQDPRINAMAHYWMAESYYGKGDLQAALRKYDELRNSPGAYATELYEQAGYGMGYTYFKLKDHAEAAVSFRRFVMANTGDQRQRADAMMRIGDCAFVARDNATALRWYEDAIRLQGPDTDYARYQKGVVQGLLRDHAGKVATLTALLNEQPGSRFAADARFQLAETHIHQENDNAALAQYRTLIEQHPNSPHVHAAMLQIALVHRRQDDPAKALEQYKAIVAKYPTMDGARDALAGIEAIHIQQGRLDEYEAYVRTLAFVDPTTLDLDEKYFRSAEEMYFNEQCDRAIGVLGDYLAKYPGGAYALNARFYRGDCLYRAGEHDRALPDLEAVAAGDLPQFLESALFGAADISFRQQRWEGALDHFTRLEQVAAYPQNKLAAQLGRMRSLRAMGRPAEAADAARTVLDNPDAAADIKAEAGLVLAHGELAREQYDAAYTAFRNVSQASTTATGAEAKFHQCYIRHLQGRHADAEKEVFELVQRYPAHDHWKARAFIVLGEAYAAMGDIFQAEATLRSVIDNSLEPELVAQARQRLDAILAAEAGPEAPPTAPDAPEVPMPGTDSE
ncbi:MAG: tetratricopeptide repeat protein [Flavobacteriales bacterium]|nr:tetratricopeptide repeat protein [Flavobacteriales bacterium]